MYISLGTHKVYAINKVVSSSMVVRGQRGCPYRTEVKHRWHIMSVLATSSRLHNSIIYCLVVRTESTERETQERHGADVAARRGCRRLRVRAPGDRFYHN